MLDKIQIVKPAEIEKRSMEIITSELNGRTWPEPEFSIVKRCIHTSADFVMQIIYAFLKMLRISV